MLEIVIKGKEGEGKSTIAIIVADALVERGLAFRFEDPKEAEFYNHKLLRTLELEKREVLIKVEGEL